MSGTAWLTVAVLAAIWPFGRNRDEEAASGTIRDLEAEVVAVDSSRVIESSERKLSSSGTTSAGRWRSGGTRIGKTARR
jgi:hypothetical protein